MKDFKMITVLVLIPFFLITSVSISEADTEMSQSNSQSQNLQKATFAGGCFWCMEPSFEKLKGIKSVVSGYIGGHKEHPTYQEVSSGETGHCEAIEVLYDPSQTSYKELLDLFWENIDPTAVNEQFVDVGD